MRFDRVFKKIDKKTQSLILDEIEQMAKDPFVHPNIRKIVGVKQNAYRLRVGRWRVLYFVLSKEQLLEIIDLFIRKGRGDYREI